MGFKKILFGEKVPDKDDPKYKEELCVQAYQVIPGTCFLFRALQRGPEPLSNDTGRQVPATAFQCCRTAGKGTSF